MREIVFDTETTGLSPLDGHRLVEIGCVELVNKVETGRTFHGYFNPDRSMPPEAEAVHGLSIRFLADKPAFCDTAHDLLAFLEDSHLVAHNAAFDFGFLNHELDRAGHSAICTKRMIDTLAIARTRHPGAKHSLDALCTRYGIDRSHRVKHGALLDAQLLAQLYVELTGGRQIGFSLRTDGPAQVTSLYAGAQRSPRQSIRVRPPRPHMASAEELVRHSAFVSTLADPLWKEATTPG
jgi:DNA polymerase-3 subunit epsilon